MSEDILKHFSTLEDTRVQGRTLHPMKNIVFITLVGAICGITSWEDIYYFAKERKGFFEKYLDLTNGIPSEDTLRRFFQNLNPKSFQEHFTKWAKSIAKDVDCKTISLDGKRICTASNMNSENPIHIVSAWLSEKQIVLGQVKTGEKSNEITAIPELLKALDVKGSMITIDAMGYQTDIAKQIASSEADYLLAVKGNQPTLYEDVIRTFKQRVPCHGKETLELGNGRIEQRKCLFTSNFSFIRDPEKWERIAGIVKVESTQINKKTGKVSKEVRYFITSSTNQDRVLAAVRKHWGIESMHWILDVQLGEDASLKRVDHSAENFNVIRKIVVNLMKEDGYDHSVKKMSIKRKQIAAIINEHYLEYLLARL
ncbi:ISAs1 family transposase [Bacteroidales bacterium OttesenSCG-928-C03]|nr:ISAs1 family transposase [Bacteroidales bacterium OttesenSCG-928-C03]MDL2326274.1 ISAs1 family transposase [Bacteroidales bacterium OttesenSCG-928-A14]